MRVIEDLLREEKERNLQAQELYRNQIQGMPRGSVAIKKVGDRAYCYLRYRDRDKVRMQYVGVCDGREKQLEADVSLRKHYEQILADLRYDMSLIKKVVKDD